MEKKIKIKREEYLKIKNGHLTKTQSLRTLYLETNRKNYIDKKTFMQLINKIRTEAGYPEYKPNQKVAKKYIKYSHLCKND